MEYLKYFLSVQLLIFSSLVVAQSGESFFSGTVRDSKTKNPIPFVTIYVNGTTKGCLSNEKGEFNLKGLTYPCKVVVSQISYIPQVLEIDKNIEGSEIYMTLNVISLKEVTIESNSSDARTKNLDRFKTWFLGTDYWGSNAELLNDSVLLFFRDEQGFKASAAAPLDILLPELGYRLRVDLVHFLINVNMVLRKEQCFYTAYYYYSPYIPKTKREASIITRNRLKAYYCSELHFNRSVFQDSLSSNGYEIKRELKSYNQSVFNPNDIKKEYVNDPNNKKLAILSSHKGYQYVIIYYQKNGMPIDIQKTNKKPVPNQDFISRIYFVKDSCTIRENGTTADYSVMFDGIIGDKSVGSMLPDTYYPERKR